MKASLVLLVGQVVAGGPVQWSWDTPAYFIHCSNKSGPLNANMLQVMAKASFTVVEKWQCLYCQPNMTGAEDKMIAAADQIRGGQNRAAAVFLYWQADWARRWYAGGVWFDEHPELELHNANGSLFVQTTGGGPSAGSWHAYDFSNNASVAAWASQIADTYTKGRFDGVLVDGVKPSCPDPDATPEVAAAFAAGKAASGNVLNAALPGAAHQLANVDVPPKGYNGNMLEFFQGTNESMNKLLALKGSFVEVHATSRGGDFPLSFAAYLICAEPGMYFGAAIGRFGGWSDCTGWSDPSITSHYAKALGEPTNPAVYHLANGSWTRTFGSGTTVLVTPGGKPPGGGKKIRGGSCIWFSDGTALGSLCGVRAPSGTRTAPFDNVSSHGDRDGSGDAAERERGGGGSGGGGGGGGGGGNDADADDGLADLAADADLAAAAAAAVGARHALTKAEKEVYMWWKPANTSTLASDVLAMKTQFCVTDVIIYCGMAVLGDGRVGLEPNGPTNSSSHPWGLPALCPGAVAAASNAGLGVQIILEARSSAGPTSGNAVQAAFKRGGNAVGLEAVAAVRSLTAGAAGAAAVTAVNIDFEEPWPRTWEPTTDEVRTFTTEFAAALRTASLEVTQCYPFASTGAAPHPVADGGVSAVFEMGTYTGANASNWDEKLAFDLNMFNNNTDHFAVGLMSRNSKHPQPWENETASVVSKFRAMKEHGITKIALFSYPGFSNAFIWDGLLEAWQAQIKAFVSTRA